jgi:probable HAF family extracellular repeat protein
MKLILTSLAAYGLLASLAMAQPSERRDRPPRYTVTDLGPADNPFSQAALVNSAGLVTGVAAASDGTTHAALWKGKRFKDIGAPGLNSAAFGLNERGQVVGQAETQEPDPNGENFCGYGTNFKCVPFLWQDGVMTQLPTLGGNNGWANMINNRGEIAGAAESDKVDSTCAPGPAVNGTGPQILRLQAVVWGPRPGHIRRLRPLRGDTVGMAFWINDNGQAVGSSGSCATTVLPPFVAGEHAVLWDIDGSAHDLGNLGGAVNTAALGVGNHAFSINNRGQVVGIAAVPGVPAGSPSTNDHAFLWTRAKGMQDLGTLNETNINSAAFAINDRGDVVGVSQTGNVGEGFPSAFLWRNGVMSDLNDLIPADSPMHLAIGAGINDAGEIVGFGFTADSAVHAFLAIPSNER